MEDGCEADLSVAGVPDSVKVGPPPAATAGGARVWGLRNCREVVIPEGTERIGNYWFYGCGIEDITFPASVKEIGAWAFCCCKCPTRVTFARNSRLERIGSRCFYGSGIQGLTLPGTLQEIVCDSFGGCGDFETIYVEAGCDADLSLAGVPEAARVIPLWTPLTRDTRVESLRQTKHAVFPEGMEKIGSFWFWGSGIEGMTVPKNVREIGSGAFCNCHNLRRVRFAPKSRLARIETGSFRSTGIEKIVIPRGVWHISDNAFSWCQSPREVVFERGNRLESIGKTRSSAATGSRKSVFRTGWSTSGGAVSVGVLWRALCFRRVSGR